MPSAQPPEVWKHWQRFADDGDRAAFAALWSAVHGRLLAYARTRIGGKLGTLYDGEDLVMSVCKSLLRARDEGRALPPAGASADVVRLLLCKVRRKLLDKAKREDTEKRRGTVNEASLAAATENSAGGLDQFAAPPSEEECLRALDETIEGLADPEVQAAFLLHSNGRAPEEIATELRWSRSKAYRKLDLARAYLEEDIR